MSINLWTVQKWKEVEQGYFKSRKGIKINYLCKRLFDVIVSGTLCLILLPVLVSIALAVRISSPGSILFNQERLGKLGNNFTVYKFRTMIDGATSQGVGLATFKGDPRVTPIGKFLREYHLDELPQIFNVFLGDMSLVGPRPVMPSALPTYTEWERQRLLIPPGITGWQQVNGGALIDVDERIQQDIWYTENWSFWLDLFILLKTIPVVLTKDGVYGADGWQRGRGEAFESTPETDLSRNINIPEEEFARLQACLKEAAVILHRHTPIGEATSLDKLEKRLAQQIIGQFNNYDNSMLLSK